MIALDLYGQLKNKDFDIKEIGKFHILTMVDVYSRYVRLEKTNRSKGKDVFNVLTKVGYTVTERQKLY